MVPKEVELQGFSWSLSTWQAGYWSLYPLASLVRVTGSRNLVEEAGELGSAVPNPSKLRSVAHGHLTLPGSTNCPGLAEHSKGRGGQCRTR